MGLKVTLADDLSDAKQAALALVQELASASLQAAQEGFDALAKGVMQDCS
jgi:hypothetical protein